MKRAEREAFRARLTKGRTYLGVSEDDNVSPEGNDPNGMMGEIGSGADGGYPGAFGSAGTFQYLHGRSGNPLMLDRPADTMMPSVDEDSFVRVDQDVDGYPGLVDNLPYSIGPVGSNFIDTHAMRGQVLRIRTRPLNADGPVGAQAYTNQLQLAMDQAVIEMAYEEASQASVLSGYAGLGMGG